jgi:hypothetical protein
MVLASRCAVSDRLTFAEVADAIQVKQSEVEDWIIDGGMAFFSALGCPPPPLFLSLEVLDDG